jgi:hypothetical protein
VFWRSFSEFISSKWSIFIQTLVRMASSKGGWLYPLPSVTKSDDDPNGIKLGRTHDLC